MRRSIERYAACDAKAIAGGSEAQTIFFIEDAKADIRELAAALQECADYFDNRADADHDGEGFVPNEEMKLLSVCNRALGQA
jgi:hypothetical protein